MLMTRLGHLALGVVVLVLVPILWLAEKISDGLYYVESVGSDCVDYVRDNAARKAVDE